MRASSTDRRKSPPGVNLAPPLKLWSLTGGATYDPTQDAVTLPLWGQMMIPDAYWAKLDGRAWRFEFDHKVVDGITGRALVNTRYYDAWKQPHTVPGGWVANGVFLGYPSDQWGTVGYSGTSVMWDTDLMYMGAYVQANPTYIDGPIMIRNPRVVVVP